MTPRPSAIRVFGKKHSVIWECDNLGDASGEINFGPCVISIAGKIADDEAKETLLHELIHAVEHQLGIDIPEQKLRGFSVGLFAVMRDNPELPDFLFGGSNAA